MPLVPTAGIITPPNCVVVAVANPIVPLVLVMPLVPTAGIITPPNVVVVVAGNVYVLAPLITPLPLIVMLVPSTLINPSTVVLAVGILLVVYVANTEPVIL